LHASNSGLVGWMWFSGGGGTLSSFSMSVGFRGQLFHSSGKHENQRKTLTP
jgi:hypothetical protein